MHQIDRTRPKSRFAGDYDVVGFSFMGFGIGSAAEIHLLGAEEDDANCPAGALRQAGDQSGGAEGDGHAGTVIGGAGAQIPGIEMSADENDLVRTVRAFDLTDDIPGWRVLVNRRRQQEPDPHGPSAVSRSSCSASGMASAAAEIRGVPFS